jgi:hypothetical protein
MKINKSNAAILAVVILLSLMVAALAVLNYNDARERAARQHDATFIIQADGQTFIVDYDMLREIGIRDFIAVKRSGGSAVQVNYQGVPLKYICGKLGIGLADISGAAAFAADGYTVAVSIDKINDPENVFIATGENGVLLKNKENGGDGPYMLVIVKDPFAQFWCKYLSEIIFR